jgi:hypothetical protein
VATGDQEDVLARLISVLPPWFKAGATPVLDALLGGAAWAGSFAYGMIRFARQQARIATATGGWLDLAAYDFFGRDFVRPAGWTDAQFGAAITARLLNPNGTRPGLIAGIEQLTGRAPRVFEPWNPTDTGGYGGALNVPWILYEDFLVAGALSARWNFARASEALSIDASGSYQRAPRNVARFDHDPSTRAPLGVLIEPASVNMIRNPNGQGAAAPGALPTYWSVSVPSGVTMSVAGTGAEDGLPYVDLAFAGSASGDILIAFEQPGAVPASPGQNWTMSLFAKLSGGAATNIANTVLGFTVYSGGGSVLGTEFGDFSPPSAGVPLATQRNAVSAGTGYSGTAYLVPWAELAIGGAVSFTLRLAAPQIEPLPSSTSPMIPQSGMGTTARDGDHMAALITPMPAVTVWTEFDITAEQPSPNVLAGIDDGAGFSNAVYLWTIAGGLALGGVGEIAALPWSQMPGTVQRAAFAGGEGAAFALNGTAEAAAGASPIADGLGFLTLGQAPWSGLNGGAQWLGHMRQVIVFPAQLSAAELATITGSSWVPGSEGSAVGTGLGYGVAGGYGALNLPNQVFIQVLRPATRGVQTVEGYATPAAFPVSATGGYGSGAIAYVEIADTPGQLSDSDIYAAVAALMPAGCVAWTAITSAAPAAGVPGAFLTTGAGRILTTGSGSILARG